MLEIYVISEDKISKTKHKRKLAIKFGKKIIK